LQTVVQTPTYLASAKREGISEAERAVIVVRIAAVPQSGAIMAGTGGARKTRIARPGGGKSGSYRLISFYGGGDMPVFLLDIYSKAFQQNLSKAECDALRAILQILAQTYKRRPSK